MNESFDNCSYASLDNLGNFTDALEYCSECDKNNPWCGRYGAQRIIDIIYLVLVVVIGTFGNILVICSINYANRLYKHGNVFVVNLALVDLTVTGLYLPTAIANVFKTQQAINQMACDIASFSVFLTCTCSIANLALIAVNRYFSIIHSNLYQRVFSKKRMYMFAVGTWVWSFLLGLPTITGWSGLGYDPKMQLCSWDDTKSLEYNIFAATFSIIIPVIITTGCYVMLFKTVRSKSMMSSKARSSSNASSKSSSNKKEMNLLRTLAITVMIFVVCWAPYGGAILIDPRGINPHAKKIFGWIGLTNSCLNFIIYGLMNPVYRRDYKRFIFCILCLNRKTKTRFSSSSDFTSTRRAKTRKTNLSTASASSNNIKATIHQPKKSTLVSLLNKRSSVQL